MEKPFSGLYGVLTLQAFLNKCRESFYTGIWKAYDRQKESMRSIESIRQMENTL